MVGGGVALWAIEPRLSSALYMSYSSTGGGLVTVRDISGA